MNPFLDIQKKIFDQTASINEDIQRQRANMPGAPKLGGLDGKTVVYKDFGALSAAWQSNGNDFNKISNKGNTVFVQKNGLGDAKLVEPDNKIINLVPYTEGSYKINLSGIDPDIEVWFHPDTAARFGLAQ